MEVVKVLLYQKVGEVFKKEKRKIVEFILEKHVYPEIPQFIFPQKRQDLPQKIHYHPERRFSQIWL
jgi:hypothetical protein